LSKADPLLGPGFSLREETRNYQRKIIRRALLKNDGNWAAAARDLGMHRSNLHNLAKRLGMREKSKPAD
jgi:anaerobic nitric oxide reductase transcription regulator